MRGTALFCLLSAITASVPAATSVDDRITAQMKQMIAQHEVTGAVTLLASRDGVTHVRAVGTMGVGSDQPLTVGAIFWIASMSKPITGAAVMMLRDKGKLSVDDPVSKYIPAFSQLRTPAGRPANLTLRHLMTHTSGLAEATPQEMSGAKSLADLTPAYLSKPMFFEPGSEWKYCQSGINTLGRIVEIVSGESFDRFLLHRLFEPLGMVDTTFYLKPGQLPRLVTPAKRNEDGSLSSVAIAFLQGKSPDSTDRYPAANGGLFSTAQDYAKFARMMLNGGSLNGRRYLRPESVKEMTTIQTAELKTGFTPGNGWGLTVCVVREPQGVTAMLSKGSYGHGGAYGTQAWIDPVKGTAMILMVQRSNFRNSDDSPVRLAFQQAAAGE